MSVPNVSTNSFRNKPIAAALRMTTRCSWSRMMPSSGLKSRSSASCRRRSSICRRYCVELMAFNACFLVRRPVEESLDRRFHDDFQPASEWRSAAASLSRLDHASIDTGMAS